MGGSGEGLGGFWQGLGVFWAPLEALRALFCLIGVFLGTLGVLLGALGQFLVKFLLIFVDFYRVLASPMAEASEASEQSERAKLSGACSGFPLLTHAFAGVPLLSLVSLLLSLLSLALPCVTCFNSPKTISLLLLHAPTTLICLRASRSLLRQVFLF